MRSASPDIIVEFGPQGSSPLQDISTWITSDLSMGTDGIFADVSAYSHTSTQNLAVGFIDTPDITLEGFFEDDDNGPFDVFGVGSGPNTDPYTLRVTWTAGSPATYSELAVHIKTPFTPMGKVKDVTRFKVVLTQAGGGVQHYRNGQLVS